MAVFFRSLILGHRESAKQILIVVETTIVCTTRWRARRLMRSRLNPVASAKSFCVFPRSFNKGKRLETRTKELADLCERVDNMLMTELSRATTDSKLIM